MTAISIKYHANQCTYEHTEYCLSDFLQDYTFSFDTRWQKADRLQKHAHTSEANKSRAENE